MSCRYRLPARPYVYVWVSAAKIKEVKLLRASCQTLRQYARDTKKYSAFLLEWNLEVEVN